jgi:hypothetical protein
MSAFEDFVQLELPKRPYLDSDVATETVIVRRGAGPRQLGAVTMSNGQVLGMVGGVVVGTTISALGMSVRKYILTVTTANTVWNVPHNLSSTNVIVQVVDSSGFVIIPKEIQIVDANNVQVTFNTAQTGTVRVIFLD